MSKSITPEIKAQVQAIVEQFNQTVVRNPQAFFSVRFRSQYVYIDRALFGNVGPRGRLTWTGDMANWDFAIYKYSNERYDPDEGMFPGTERVNGTVKGALRACMEAYP